MSENRYMSDADTHDCRALPKDAGTPIIQFKPPAGVAFCGITVAKTTLTSAILA